MNFGSQFQLWDFLGKCLWRINHAQHTLEADFSKYDKSAVTKQCFSVVRHHLALPWNESSSKSNRDNMQMAAVPYFIISGHSIHR